MLHFLQNPDSNALFAPCAQFYRHRVLLFLIQFTAFALRLKICLPESLFHLLLACFSVFCLATICALVFECSPCFAGAGQYAPLGAVAQTVMPPPRNRASLH